jgi:hypothetical protein
MEQNYLLLLFQFSVFSDLFPQIMTALVPFRRGFSQTCQCFKNLSDVFTCEKRQRTVPDRSCNNETNSAT